MEKELKELGLSDYESRAYLALVKLGSSTGLNISKESQVPQGKVYATLYRLIEKGFVFALNSKPKIFKVVDPEVAIRQFLKDKKASLEDLERSLPKRIKSLKIAKKDETDEKVSLFIGKKNAFIPNHHIMESCKKTLDIMFTFEIIFPKTKRLLIEKLRKGVKIRVLATKKANKSLIKEILGYGIKVRHYPVQEIRIFTRDREEANIQVVNPKDFYDRTNILIQSKELSSALTDYFDSVWKKAEVLGP
jgi:HTH-type transcriptional regulator, sugar sensing transcriptional regulator